MEKCEEITAELMRSRRCWINRIRRRNLEYFLREYSYVYTGRLEFFYELSLYTVI